jgi:hypothetical protein
MSKMPQETKVQTVAAAVTEQEKWFCTLAARTRGSSISELLRDVTLDELIEDGRRLNQALLQQTS